LAAAGCDALWAPPPEEVYPPGFDTWVEPGAVAEPLEGARRPGHFRGVATVVLKLLNVWQPERAYFGRKDAQQLAVIRAMARDLDLPVAVLGCATVRAADGLALSSRNSYLDAAERRAAPVLYRALAAAEAAWAGGQTDAERLRQAALAVLAGEPLAEVDYVSVADAETLAELETVSGPALVSGAVRIGRTRLIDNLTLGAAPGAD
jgi:pantoate--beta-alanine ligase